jgi:Mg-chelatase subunit ChlD
MLKRKKCLFYILLFLLTMYSTGITQEEKTKNLLVIIDSSRSMLQLTRDGKEKLWAAKTALSKLIDKLPDDVNVALMVFGHRDKYKCDDIEIVLPLTPLDKAAIRENLDALRPTGVTPLMSALDQAAEHLEKFKGKSTILLLTDGQETCGGDPVKLVSNISAKYGIIVIVDVVGLNVKLIERTQLEAIAKAGGGKFYSADTSSELASAVTEAVELKVMGIQPGQGTDRITENGELGTLLINHRHILSSIDIYNQYTGERADGQVMWAHSENQYNTLLNPGLYRIKIYSPSVENPTEIENVRIKPNKKTTINVD